MLRGMEPDDDFTREGLARVFRPLAEYLRILPTETAKPGMGLVLNSGEAVYIDKAERVVIAPVLVPGRFPENLYDDLWDAETIRLLSRRFMADYQSVDVMHSLEKVAVPVESFYLPLPEEGGQDSYRLWGVDIPPGTWVLSAKINDDTAWEQVLSGQLRAFSMMAIPKETASVGFRMPVLTTAYASPDDIDEDVLKALEPGPDAPPRIVFNANEWDVISVALVDEPAVPRAMFAAINRAPKGDVKVDPDATLAMYRSYGATADALSVVEQVSRGWAEIGNAPAVSYSRGEGMKRKYVADMDDDEQVNDTQVDDEVDEDAADSEDEDADAPEDDADDDKAVDDADDGGTDGDGDDEADDEDGRTYGPTLDEIRDAIREEVTPVAERVEALEGNYRAMDGRGALPGRGGVAGSDDDGETPKGVPWAAPYGGKPLKDEAAG